MEDSILQRIYSSVLKFLIPLTSEKTYSTIVDEAVELVDGEYGSLVFRQGGEFVKVYSSSPLGYKTKVRKNAYAYRTFVERKPRIVHISQTEKAHPELKKVGIQSSIHIPLSYKNESIGVLIVNSKKNQKFSKKELDILVLFGSLASLAIRKTQLYSETKKALDLRDEFLSMAAHELRTPLTTIIGYSQLLNSKLKGSGSSESRWTEQLLNESFRLKLLVNEVLETSRINIGEVNYDWKECNVKEIIQRAIVNFGFNHPDHKLMFNDFVKGDGVFVIGDFDKLLQVLDNLLDNAAKFSAPSSTVVLEIICKLKHLNIRIKDRGRGISERDLVNIYERFYVGKNHKVEGMGLGLFLVKNILEQHRGEIKVRSKEGVGTSVIIRLPAIKNER